MKTLKVDPSDFQHGIDQLCVEIEYEDKEHAHGIMRVLLQDLNVMMTTFSHPGSAATEMAIYLERHLEFDTLPEVDWVRQIGMEVIFALGSTMTYLVARENAGVSARANAAREAKRGKVDKRKKFIAAIYAERFIDKFGGKSNAVPVAEEILRNWEGLTEETEIEGDKAPSLRVIQDAIRSSSRYSTRQSKKN